MKTIKTHEDDVNKILSRKRHVDAERAEFLKNGIIGPISCIQHFCSDLNIEAGDFIRSIVEDNFEVGFFEHREDFNMIAYKSRSTPIGYFAAYKDPETGNIGTAYSLTNIVDAAEFDKFVGQHLAMSRAMQNAKRDESDRCFDINDVRLLEQTKYYDFMTSFQYSVVRLFPISVQSQMNYFKKRIKDYFKLDK